MTQKDYRLNFRPDEDIPVRRGYGLLGSSLQSSDLRHRLTNDYLPQSTSWITNWLEHQSVTSHCINVYFKDLSQIEEKNFIFVKFAAGMAVISPYFDRDTKIYLTDVPFRGWTELNQ